ncbi:MAG: glycoside hydrolase family 1 protein [Chloroflexi bacterium]|nr:glycoside hydrolase family 1 protein [Chloroflexota bacterium]
MSFPDGFLWGAATAAHQIEGNNVHSDWWQAEQTGRLPHSSGSACDSWNRWRDDIRLLSEMGLNAYRLSIEWARVEPYAGRFDQVALDRYRAQLEALRHAGIEPLVTLHHFTNPRWLAERGGWSNPDVVPRFVEYAGRVIDQVKDLVRWWVTINEPSILAFKSYIEGAWPPQEPGNLRGYVRLLRHAARGHVRVSRLLRRARPDAMVSMAFAIWPLQALRPWSPIDQAMAFVGDWLWQGRVIRRTLPALDWIGLNYYSRTLVGWPRPSTTPPGSRERTDFGWEIYPEGLYAVLRRLGRFKKPVLITENGIADADDDQRPAYIVAHARQMQRAIEDGVDLRGYMHWSLLDNFEWAEGYEQHFGLATRDRVLRPSARLYGRIARANGAADDLLGTFSVT